MTKKGARHRQKKSQKVYGKGMRQTSNEVVAGYIFTAAPPASPVLGRFQPLSHTFGLWMGNLSPESPFASLAAFLAFIFYSRHNGENLAPANRCPAGGGWGWVALFRNRLILDFGVGAFFPFRGFSSWQFLFWEISRAHARVSFLLLIINIIYKEVFDDYSDNSNDIKPTN